MQFKGLVAVPGFAGLPSTADLVAVWKTTAGQLFRTTVRPSVLDTPVIARSWLQQLSATGGTTRYINDFEDAQNPVRTKIAVVGRQLGAVITTDAGGDPLDW